MPELHLYQRIRTITHRRHGVIAHHLTALDALTLHDQHLCQIAIHRHEAVKVLNRYHRSALTLGYRNHRAVVDSRNGGVGLRLDTYAQIVILAREVTCDDTLGRSYEDQRIATLRTLLQGAGQRILSIALHLCTQHRVYL